MPRRGHYAPRTAPLNDASLLDDTSVGTLTSIAPLRTMALREGIMTSDGTSCVSTISQNDNARTGTTALRGSAAAGGYCVRV